MLYLPRTTSLTGALWRFKIRTRALSVVTFVAKLNVRPYLASWVCSLLVCHGPRARALDHTTCFAWKFAISLFVRRRPATMVDDLRKLLVLQATSHVRQRAFHRYQTRRRSAMVRFKCHLS